MKWTWRQVDNWRCERSKELAFPTARVTGTSHTHHAIFRLERLGAAHTQLEFSIARVPLPYLVSRKRYNVGCSTVNRLCITRLIQSQKQWWNMNNPKKSFFFFYRLISLLQVMPWCLVWWASASSGREDVYGWTELVSFDFTPGFSSSGSSTDFQIIQQIFG